MQTTEKLTTLREKLRDAGMDGYVVTTGDFHGSEYVGSFFKTRAWLSGFTGSAGTLVVLPERAALWTDGRYFLQAGQQLAGSTIELMREGQPGVPSVADFLAEHLPRGGTLGFDGRTVSAAFARGLEKALAPREIRFAADRDLVGEIWADRPALSAEPVWELDAALAGLTREEKLALLRRDMAAQDADTLLLTALDEIAWTLNLRGGDVACTPVFLSFLLIGRERAVLCVQRQILSPEIERALAACGVELAPYADIYDRIAHLPAGTTLLADSASANSRIIRSVPRGVTLLDRPSPVILHKAVKTEAEQANIRAAHVKDGVAVCRFLYWLKTCVGYEEITERSAAAKLESFRAEQADYLGASFDPIAAYGAHAAIVHYDPAQQAEETCLAPRGLCLFDTGGHYLQGTTDITRTVALGPVTADERRLFTPPAPVAGAVPAGRCRAGSRYSRAPAAVGAGAGLPARHRPRRRVCAERPRGAAAPALALHPRLRPLRAAGGHGHLERAGVLSGRRFRHPAREPPARAPLVRDGVRRVPALREPDDGTV